MTAPIFCIIVHEWMNWNIIGLVLSILPIVIPAKVILFKNKDLIQTTSKNINLKIGDKKMNVIHKIFGRVCQICPFCICARKHPDSTFFKIMNSAFHGSWCPAWQGYKKLEAKGILKKKKK